MKDLIAVFMHLITTLAKLIGPGGARAVVADSLLMKQQLLVISRSRQRAPNLTPSDRFLLGLCSLFLAPRHIRRRAIIIRPSTLLRFHDILKKRKYRLLYSSGSKGKPGPKGPSQELIDAIVAMRERNPRFGCPRIAQQMNLAFGLDIDKDVVRRILAIHYRPDRGSTGPSWLTTLGHTKDSLWSLDLFRCESILLKTHWVLVIMDQFTRRIIGFGIPQGEVDGPALCRMFNVATSKQDLPRYLSSDNDPLFLYHQWRANLRILEIDEVKSVPYIPISHPFVERLIGSIRRELLDQTFFWTATDLERKLLSYQQYFNHHRTHSGLDGGIPVRTDATATNLNDFRWQCHCRGLFELHVAA